MIWGLTLEPGKLYTETMGEEVQLSMAAIDSRKDLGLTLEPGKLYTETMGEEVQLSMAAIDSRKDLDETPSTNFCQIVIQTEKGEYVLCTLVHGVMFQQNLDLKLMPREKVTFSVQGPSVVYLVGYTASYPEDEEEMGMQLEEYEEDSSAWESFQEGDSMMGPIKEEPVEVLDDSDADNEMESKSKVQEEIAARLQGQTEGAPSAEPSSQSREGEMFSSVAALPPTAVKMEIPDRNARLPVVPGVMKPPQQQLQGDLHRSQTSTDQGMNLPQTGTGQDFFYQGTQQQQQQSDMPLAPPEAFQPMTSGPGYQNPQTGVPPPAQTFLQTQSPVVQRAQTGPGGDPSPAINLQPTGARGSVPSVNAQRTSMSPRGHYGASRHQPSKRGRGRTRTIRDRLQQSGASQQNYPGPSSSDLPLSNGREYSQNRSMPHSSTLPSSHDPSASSSRPSIKKLGKTKTAEGDNQQKGKVFICRFCSKAFPNTANLRRHELVHTGERPFSCSHCPKTFTQKYNLKSHERTHTGEKPFACSLCPDRFARKCALRKHILMHAERKTFACCLCSSSFDRKGALRKHVLTHAAE